MTDRDRVLNVTPTPQDLALAASLPTGLHAPKPIVNNEVEILEEKLQSSSEEDAEKQANKVNVVPSIAEDALYQIARDAVDNLNVILVDDEVRICNMQPSPSPEKDFTIVQAFLASGASDEQIVAAMPSKLDLRDTLPTWVVKDQKATGACAGFSAASLCEYAFIKSGRLPSNMQINPRSIWMGAKETDSFTGTPTTYIEQEGTSLTAVLRILQSLGCVTTDFMPFESLYTKSLQSYQLQAARLRILSFFNLGKSIDSWRKWLSQYGPIYAAITVDSSWQNASLTNGPLKNYNSSQIYGGHAVVICGYDMANKMILFKNSWGSNWGDGGYVWASESWCNQAVLEAYGIAV